MHAFFFSSRIERCSSFEFFQGLCAFVFTCQHPLRDFTEVEFPIDKRDLIF